MAFKGERQASERDVWCIIEFVTCVLRNSGRPLPVLIFICSLSLILILSFFLSLSIIQIITRLHVTCVIRLFQLEVRIVELFRISLFLFSHLFFLGEVVWSVRAWQCVNVRWESSIVSNTFLSLNMVCLAMVSLHILPLFHYIQTSTRSWERTDRWLEISFAGPCFCHFTSGQISLIV